MFASRTDWSFTPNRLSQELEERRRRGLPVIDLTESNPTRCGFAYESKEILGALADPHALTYEPDPRGLVSARLAVASYYAERGIKVEPGHIFLTSSTSEAYSYVFRLIADPGDSVLVPRPSYPLLEFLARLADLELVPYPLEYDQRWRIDLEGVTSGVCPRTRAILVVHPNNPTGSYVRKGEHENLVSLCQKHNLALISDEVFADYAFAPDDTRVPNCGSPEILTFTLSGLSKISGLPQMKLAWVIVNGPAESLRSATQRLELIADTYLSVSGPVAHALPRLLETRHTLQPQILKRVQSNLRWTDGQLSANSVPARLQTEGGWYAILKVPSTRSDEDWAIRLLDREGVLVHPGHFYDFPSEGHLIISLLPAPDTFKEGFSKILGCVRGDQR